MCLSLLEEHIKYNYIPIFFHGIIEILFSISSVLMPKIFFTVTESLLAVGDKQTGNDSIGVILQNNYFLLFLQNHLKYDTLFHVKMEYIYIIIDYIFSLFFKTI